MSGETEDQPSAWTTDSLHELLMRLLASERDFVNGKNAVLEERLNGIDKATRVLDDTVTRVPTEVQKEVMHLRELALEKFNSVQTQFEERDRRGERESEDNKVAVNAAFAAQKEAACITIDTVILCADLVWRPAGDLLVGDELIAFDEDAPPGTGGRSGEASRGRKFRKATVTGNRLERDALLLVNTPRGSVRCTYEHPWLARLPHHVNHRRTWHWVRADELTPGMQVLHLLDVWEVDRSYEGGWLSGMYDGEGCLAFNGTAGRLSIVQRSSPTADRIGAALKSRTDFVAKERYPANEAAPTAVGRHRENRQPVMTYTIDTRANVMKILGSIRPERLLVNAERVWLDRTITGKFRMTTVDSVEGAGTGMVSRLSTSTHTYIAHGFAMHNSEQNKSNTLAIAKSEAATSETISKLAELFKTTTDSLATMITVNTRVLNDKIDDLKERVGTIENRKAGAVEQTQTSQTSISQFLAVIGAVVAVVSIAVAIMIATRGGGAG